MSSIDSLPNEKNEFQRFERESLITLYFSSTKYNVEDVLNSLPSQKELTVIETRSSSKTIEYTTDSGKKTKIVRNNEAVLLLNREYIDKLRYYIKVHPNRNFYPRENQDATSLYCKFTPDQKVEADRIIRNFCRKTGMKFPRFVPGNGFSFYIFDERRNVPQLIGLLNSYPTLEGARFRYGIKRDKQNRKDDEKSEEKELLKK